MRRAAVASRSSRCAPSPVPPGHHSRVPGAGPRPGGQRDAANLCSGTDALRPARTSPASTCRGDSCALVRPSRAGQRVASGWHRRWRRPRAGRRDREADRWHLHDVLRGDVPSRFWSWAAVLVGCSGDADDRPAAPSSAQVLDEAFAAVVDQVQPSVVEISHEGSVGSGVVFDRQGHIVTNAHVVGTASTFEVRLANSSTVR